MNDKDKNRFVCQGSCKIAYYLCPVKAQGVKCPFERRRKVYRAKKDEVGDGQE